MNSKKREKLNWVQKEKYWLSQCEKYFVTCYDPKESLWSVKGASTTKVFLIYGKYDNQTVRFVKKCNTLDEAAKVIQSLKDKTRE